MLILNRKEKQSIIIGDGIEVFVVSIEGNQVKLGVNAPKNIKVYRRELLESIESQNREAVASTIDFSKFK
jgi:carbon storage regulator